MAIVIPMRKKYKPRHIVEAVVDNVLRLRSNCKTMKNPNTQAQQHVRSRFTLMQGLHTGLTPLLSRGFDRYLNERERWVGAYPMALGHTMRMVARYNPTTQAWECHFLQWCIWESQSRTPKQITVQRKGCTKRGFSYIPLSHPTEASIAYYPADTSRSKATTSP